MFASVGMTKGRSSVCSFPMRSGCQPVISVVMSVYNVEVFLSEGIESILNQTFRQFEFIIIDDGSTDGSRLILEKYARQDPRISLIFNERNIGLGLSLNRGLERAQGEYIARMDGDDVALPVRLERQLTFLEANRGVDLIGADMMKIDKFGNELGRRRAPQDISLLRHLIIYRTVAFHPTWFFRKSILNVLKGYRDFPVAQDYDFLLRLIDHGFVVGNYDGALLRFRICGGISSKKSLAVRKMAKYMIRLHKERLRRNNEDSYSAGEVYKMAQGNHLAVFLQNCSQNLFGKANAVRARRPVFALVLVFGSAIISWHQCKHYWRTARGKILVRRREWNCNLLRYVQRVWKWGTGV